ncbi:MAG: InlB B-repeat-containing protein, partial [Clostridia bacterium]|nr:InlB B-repeat-containing protein [Clostridia bacterium]
MKTRFKKLLSFALVLIMVITALPVSAMAEYGTEVAKSVPGIMDKVWEGWRDQWLGQLAGRISGRPAQKMQAEAVDGAYVKIDAPNLALPAGTEVRVVKLNDSDMEKVRAIAENTPGVNVETVSAYDITFFCNGKEIEPNGNVCVDMSLIGVEEGKTISIYHIDAKAGYLKTDMTCEKVENVEISDGVASFKANAFSIFFVSEHNTSGILKVEFYDTKGQLVNTQPIMAGDFVDESSMPIYDPGIVLSKADHGTRFEGWGKVSNPGDTPSGDPLEIDGVNKDVAINFSDYISSNDGIVKYKAVNVILGYAEFYDLNKELLRMKNVFLDGNLRGDVEFNVNYKPDFNDYETTGWVLEQYIEIDKTGENLPTYKTNEAGFHVYTTGGVGKNLLFGEGRLLKFYPYVKSGTWLNFNTNEDGNNARLGFDGVTDWNHTEGSKATAVDSVFYDNGIVNALPDAPTRPGYTFGGWYKDRACTVGQEFTAPTTINGQTTLYAKWNPASSSILVTVWVERTPGDDIDGNYNEPPQYEYYTTIKRGADSTLNFNLLSNTVNTAEEYTVSSSYAAGVLTLANSMNDPTNPNESLRRIYGPVDDHYFVLDQAASNVQNGVIKAKVRGDGQSVLNLYFERRTIKIKVYACCANQFTTISEEDAKTENSPLFCKPDANGFYEAVTSVPLADGYHLYFKKGLVAQPQDDGREVFVVTDGTEYDSRYDGSLYIFDPTAAYTSATWQPDEYTMYKNIMRNFPQIMEFEGKYEQPFSYWP